VIVGIDHVQVAIPRGAEPTARAFYVALLGMTEVSKPAALAGRGGCWLRSGAATLHLGVDEPFGPARKAHPSFCVDDLDVLAERLVMADYPVTWASGEIPGVRRFHTADPFGNRIEFQAGVTSSDGAVSDPQTSASR
jgi:catechol 2,3-dioxygenase-like lactoylglutathione lyase family enzyme